MNLLRISAALLALIFVSACAQPVSKSTQGTLAGGALGAGAGAIIGSKTGNAGAGIAIGAGIGALSGALVGNAIDEVDVKNEATSEQISRNNQQIAENQRLIDALRRRGADVRDSDRGVVINLPDVLFDFDSARLTREANRTVGEIAGVLRDVKGRNIAVEGHTDSIGSVEYNKRLSENRARSVARELENSGVPHNQMTVRGFGEGSPIATNNTDAGRARNRRVEVIIEN